MPEETGGETTQTSTVDVTSSEFKAALDAATSVEREGLEKARKSYQDINNDLSAVADSPEYKEIQRLRQLGRTPRIVDPATEDTNATDKGGQDSQRWMTERIAALTEAGTEAGEAKAQVLNLRGSLFELAQTFGNEIAKEREVFKKEMAEVRGELKKYMGAPERVMRDAEFDNPIIAGEGDKAVRLNDLPAEVKQGVLEVLKKFEIPVTLASQIAGGVEALPVYMEKLRDEKALAERTERAGTAGIGGGMRDFDLPLPADPLKAGLAEFMESVRPQGR